MDKHKFVSGIKKLLGLSVDQALEQKRWYRLVKVLYITLMSLIILAAVPFTLVFSTDTKPYTIKFDRVTCFDGASTRLDDINVYSIFDQTKLTAWCAKKSGSQGLESFDFNKMVSKISTDYVQYGSWAWYITNLIFYLLVFLIVPICILRLIRYAIVYIIVGKNKTNT